LLLASAGRENERERGLFSKVSIPSWSAACQMLGKGGKGRTSLGGKDLTISLPEGRDVSRAKKDGGGEKRKSTYGK